ncbi:hypothetical protein QL285_065476 [Trifolium repens]|nr:hypothetical protein QL285_065476 [Trifolium repens]
MAKLTAKNRKRNARLENEKSNWPLDCTVICNKEIKDKTVKTKRNFVPKQKCLTRTKPFQPPEPHRSKAELHSVHRFFSQTTENRDFNSDEEKEKETKIDIDSDEERK